MKTMDFSFWISDVSFSTYGKCHTLNNSVSLSSSNLYLLLNASLNYVADFHDPNFFMHTANPVIIPGVSLELKPSQGFVLNYIELIKHSNMDRAQQPCEDREDYSFTACVKNSVSSKAGCR